MARALGAPVAPASAWVGWRRPNLALAVLGAGSGLVVGAAAALGPLAAAAATLACLGGVLVLSRPALGLLVLAGLVPVLAGLRRGLPVPGLRLSEALTVGLAALILVRQDGRSSPPWRSFDWLALLYATGSVVIGAANLLARSEPFTPANLGTLFGPFQFLLLYRAALTLLGDRERRRLVLRCVLVASVPVAALAIAQRAGLGPVNTAMTQLTGVDIEQIAFDEARAVRRESLVRAAGPFPHWQVLAGYLFVVALVALALLLERGQAVLRRGWLVIVFGVAVAGMVASGTFTTTLGILVAALALGAWAGQLGRVALLVGTLAAAASVLFAEIVLVRIAQQFVKGPGSTEASFLPATMVYRYNLWREQYLPELAGRWLLGYGPDLPPGVVFPFTESVYLSLLLRGGVVLLVLYAGLMVALLARAWRAQRDPEPERRAAARALVALIVALVAFHFVEPYFLTSGLPQLFWLLAAVVLAVDAPSRTRTRTVTSS